MATWSAERDDDRHDVGEHEDVLVFGQRHRQREQVEDEQPDELAARPAIEPPVTRDGIRLLRTQRMCHLIQFPLTSVAETLLVARAIAK